MGVPSQVSSVTFNGQAVDSGWTYDSGSQVLSLTGLNNLTSSGAWNSAWTLSWSLSNNDSVLPGSASASESGSGSGSSSGSLTASGTPGATRSVASTSAGNYVAVPVLSLLAVFLGAFCML